MSPTPQCVEQNLDGSPCQSTVTALERDGLRRCLSHATDKNRVKKRLARNIAGGRNRRPVFDPADLPRIKFRTAKQCTLFYEWCARTALSSRGVDLRGLAEARAAADAAVRARGVEVQERLLVEVARLEFGNAAVVIENLRRGIEGGQTKPSPGAPSRLRLAAPPNDTDPPAS